MEARTGWSWDSLSSCSLVPKGCGDSHGARSHVLPGQSMGKTSGAEGTLIQKSQVLKCLLDFLAWTRMCSSHCNLEALTATAELGLTPYMQDTAGFEDKFSK